MFTVATVLNALELGFIYALVAMALFLSFRVLNIADMTTDGAFTLGCAVSATAAVAGHPFLGLPLAMLAGAAAAGVRRVRDLPKGRRRAFCCAACVRLCNPPMQTPDETDHYLRTYAISMGRFDFDAQRGYPEDVDELVAAFPGAWVNAHTSAGWAPTPTPTPNSRSTPPVRAETVRQGWPGGEHPGQF